MEIPIKKQSLAGGTAPGGGDGAPQAQLRWRSG